MTQSQFQLLSYLNINRDLALGSVSPSLSLHGGGRLQAGYTLLNLHLLVLG